MYDFSSTSVVGHKNRIAAIQLKEMCEALLEHTLSCRNWRYQLSGMQQNSMMSKEHSDKTARDKIARDETAQR